MKSFYTLLFSLALFALACNDSNYANNTEESEKLDEISKNRVLASDIKLEGGLYYYQSKPFTGVGFQMWNGRQVLVYETTYEDGKMHGPYKQYFPNGKLKMEQWYKNGFTEGPYKYFYESGQLKGECIINDGKRIGVKEYYENGKLSSELPDENGLFRSFFSNGQVKMEVNCIKGNKTGLYKEYYENGGQLKIEGNYKNNFIEGAHKEYYQNGKLKVEGYKQDSNCWIGSFKWYFENGNLKSEGIYEDCLPEGYWKWYNESGQLINEGNYRHGVKTN